MLSVLFLLMLTFIQPLFAPLQGWAAAQSFFLPSKLEWAITRQDVHRRQRESAVLIRAPTGHPDD